MATFKTLPLGALLQSFVINGTNIVQGFPTAEDYIKYNQPYFGETIGRVANRIANAKIDSLNGKSYSLAANNGPNALHGGEEGWGKKIWESATEGNKLVYKLRSVDGEEGYPGTVEATVAYSSGEQLLANGRTATVLNIEYTVQLVGDEVEETVVNVTNHSYFNLSGNPTIEGTEVFLCSNLYLPVDDNGIPTGGPTRYPYITPFETLTVGPVYPDVDDCFVVSQTVDQDTTLAASKVSCNLDTRGDPLITLVTAYHPHTKIHLEVASTEPAFQFYAGKYIDVPEVKSGDVTVPARGARSGFCVEPSRFVNAVNVPGWKDQVLLKKGETYGSRIVYQAWHD